MKAYKITYCNIGREKDGAWAGWGIHGKTSDILPDMIGAYETLQAANSFRPSDNLYESAPIVWELICDSKNIYYSRLKYGLRDFKERGRPAMRSDGIIISAAENPDIIKNLGSVLGIPITEFDNKLKYFNSPSDPIPEEPISESDSLTVYSSYDFDSDGYNVSCDRLFPSKMILCDLITCIYWAITDKSAVTVNLVYNGSDEDKKEIISIILKYLPYSLRRQFSCRTMDIPEAKLVKFVFCDKAPSMTRYFNIVSGENNIIDYYKLNTRWENYEFISYPIKQNEISAEDYFEGLSRVMYDMGSYDSTDMNFINVAHMIMRDGDNIDYSSLTEQEILKKLQNFLTLPYNNEIIDSICASLIKCVIDRGISLNESIDKYIMKKISGTRCAELKDIVYKYSAMLMIRSGSAEDFRKLCEMKEDAEQFGIMRNKILCENGGAEFIDRFYGDYYGRTIIDSTDTLDAFIKETQSLPVRDRIKELIKATCIEFGKGTIDDYYAYNIDIASQFRKYLKYISARLSQGNASECETIIKAYFWDCYSFTVFDYSQCDNYRAMYYENNAKSKLTIQILRCFEGIQYRSMDDVFEVTKIVSFLSNEEKSCVAENFQQECVKTVSKSMDIDFWYMVANLDSKRVAEFIIKQNIRVFTDPRLFSVSLNKSEFLSDNTNFNAFHRQLLCYAEKYGETSDIKEMKKIMMAEYNYRKKHARNMEKQQKKEEKNLKPLQEGNIFDDSIDKKESKVKGFIGRFRK